LRPEASIAEYQFVSLNFAGVESVFSLIDYTTLGDIWQSACAAIMNSIAINILSERLDGKGMQTPRIAPSISTLHQPRSMCLSMCEPPSSSPYRCLQIPVDSSLH
jgi:hypothetical protein